MREPDYQERTHAELRKALRWAMRKMCLQDWTVQLCLDNAAERKFGPFDPPDEASGRANLYAHGHHAVIGLWLDRCKKYHEEPLCVLFHEVAHISLWAIDMVDEGWKLTPHWEFLANVIAKLLFDLWGHEQEA